MPDKILNNHLKQSQWAAREHRQLNEIRKPIHKQNEKFNKVIETMKKNQSNSRAEKYND